MNIGLEVLLIILLIITNGFLAMSEAAIITVRKALLQHKANEGNSKARTVLNLIENPNRFLSTIQIGITLIGVLAGALGGVTIADSLATELEKIPIMTPYAHSISVAVVVILITFLSMLLGELVPKRLALLNAEKISFRVSGIMVFIAAVLSPVVWLLGKSTDFILRSLRIKHLKESPVTGEEILVQMGQGIQAGVFEEAEQDMVEGVFSLSDRHVNAIMTSRNEIVWLDIHDTPDEIRRKVAGSPFSRYPVAVDSLDHVLGVVKAKDFLLAEIKDSKQLKQMVHQAFFIPETALGSRALEMFKQMKLELMLVVDEFGVVQGLLTLADILEEIVGEFEDETQAVQRKDGSWLLNGRMSIDDFKEIFNLRRLPDEEEYETLGGFVFMQLGRIPQETDKFEWKNLHFEILDLDGKRIDKVLVTKSLAETTENKQ